MAREFEAMVGAAQEAAMSRDSFVKRGGYERGKLAEELGLIERDLHSDWFGAGCPPPEPHPTLVALREQALKPIPTESPEAATSFLARLGFLNMRWVQAGCPIHAGFPVEGGGEHGGA